MRFSMVVVSICAAASVFALDARGAPPDLDPTYGENGIVRFGDNVWIGAADMYPDGRLAVLLNAHATPDQRVLRLTAAGRIDDSFAAIARLPDNGIRAVAALSNGGVATLQGFERDTIGEARIARHTQSGGLDGSFGEGGTVLIIRHPYAFSGRLGPTGRFAQRLEVDASGRLYTSIEDIVAGRLQSTSITRVGANGSPVQEIHRTDAQLTPYSYRSFRVEADGDVVALLNPHSGLLQTGAALLRLSGGSPDPAFGAGGVAFTPLMGFDNAEDFAMTPDGGYVVVGRVPAALGRTILQVVKFTRSGAIDRGFGDAGIVTLRLAREDDFVRDARVSVEANGRILIGGSVQVEAAAQLVIALQRLLPDGKTDHGFAPGGVATVRIDHGTYLDSLYVTSEGRILIVGHIFNTRFGGNPEPIVAGELGDASIGDRCLFRCEPHDGTGWVVASVSLYRKRHRVRPDRRCHRSPRWRGRECRRRQLGQGFGPPLRRSAAGRG